MKDEILFQDQYNTTPFEDELYERNEIYHEDEYLTSLKNYDIINI